DRRLAARQAGAPRTRDHDQLDRERNPRIRTMAHSARSDRSLVRQGATAAGPENGACDAGRRQTSENELIGCERSILPARKQIIGASAGGQFRFCLIHPRAQVKGPAFSPSPSAYQISTRSTERGCRVQVLVRDNNVDQALKALKKKMQREGIFREMK